MKTKPKSKSVLLVHSVLERTSMECLVVQPCFQISLYTCYLTEFVATLIIDVYLLTNNL